MEAMVLHTSVVKGVTQSGSWYMYGNTCTMNQGKQDWIAFRGIESCQAINLWSVGANIDKHRYGGQTAVWSTSIASAGEMSHSCFFWLTWRPNTKIPNRSDRGAVAVTCDLEEILPSAKISRWVNQVCRDHPTGEDYPMISAQPIIEFCEKHGIKITSYGGATPLLVFQMVYWRTFCFDLDSNRRAALPLLKVRLDIAEGSNNDNGSHLHIWLMPDGWYSK